MIPGNLKKKIILILNHVSLQLVSNQCVDMELTMNRHCTVLSSQMGDTSVFQAFGSQSLTWPMLFPSCPQYAPGQEMSQGIPAVMRANFSTVFSAVGLRARAESRCEYAQVEFKV